MEYIIVSREYEVGIIEYMVNSSEYIVGSM